jgi:hypothetical protein
LGQAKVLKPVPTTSLSPNASSGDLFDWTILGLQGSWLPLASTKESSGDSELKDQALPLKFPSMAAYTAMFQKLIGEEAKAILLSEWEQFKAEQDVKAESTTKSCMLSLILRWMVHSKNPILLSRAVKTPLCCLFLVALNMRHTY